ncbi:MAG: hypothetical protein HRU35_07550 [Rickettsiaceae bacterium]|nr:hypothetical protein [Rickettsiaceae bacterium]
MITPLNYTLGNRNDYISKQDISQSVEFKKSENKFLKLCISVRNKLFYEGVSYYIKNEYLKEKLQSLDSDNDLEIANMLCLKAICIGIAMQKDNNKDYYCLFKFIDKYPNLSKKILDEQPQFFVNTNILIQALNKMNIKDKNLIAELVGDDILQVNNSDLQYDCQEFKKLPIIDKLISHNHMMLNEMDGDVIFGCHYDGYCNTKNEEENVILGYCDYDSSILGMNEMII